MNDTADGSVDMVLADPPYGITVCRWDSVINLELMWNQLKRIVKINGAIIMTANQPFTTTLISSNMKLFRYCWIWDKVNKYTGALNANKRPLKRHEEIIVFYRKLPVYNKQLRKGTPYITTHTKGHGVHTQYGNPGEHRLVINKGGRNPCSILKIAADNKKELGLHPTQKPVALMEYLIKTYTNEGELVLDFCMGSGTTGVACKNLNRNFIGIEKDKEYFKIAKKRIRK